jgi:N-acetylglucosaminylphosphatidylinositol deacetylase
MEGRGLSFLIVTAHPDDECMFFCPAITCLQQARHRVHVLCLSTGNAGGLGSRRVCELKHSCSVMGIPYSRVAVVDDSRLQDGMDSYWSPELVAEYVDSWVRAFGIDGGVITFDSYGVSGHVNHVCVWNGVKYWNDRVQGVRYRNETTEDRKDGKGRKWNIEGKQQTVEDYSERALPVYVLRSSTIVVKYASVLSFVLEPLVYRLTTGITAGGSCVTFKRLSIGNLWRTMGCHASQWTWFRRLFVLFSQYGLLNRLHRQL